MKYVAILLCCGVATQDIPPDAFYVREVTEPVMCVLEGQRVGCAYLLALFNLVRDEQGPAERGI